MKICVEIQTLASAPTGLYRYTSNLYKNYLMQFPTHELCAVSFKSHNNDPYDPELFSCLFKSSFIGKCRVKRNWFNMGENIITTPNNTKSGKEYESYRSQVRHAKLKKLNESEVKKLKYKREIARIKMQLSRSVSFVKYGSSKPIYFDDQTKVIHSPYHSFPNDFSMNLPGILYAQTVHDLIPLRFPEIFSKESIKNFKRVIISAMQCDVIFVPSEATRRDLFSCEGFHDKNIVVTPLAADNMFNPASHCEIQAVRAKFGIPDDHKYFLSVSTLEPRKNFPFLLRAFRKLISQISGRKPILVLTGRIGWGDDTQLEITQLLEQLRDYVIYTGYVTDDDLRALYSGALAFLMPSIYEGFGLPLLEAMACGTPVISSNTSSMPEVVGDAGILISPLDENLWISSMLSILHLNQNQYIQIAAQSYQHSRTFSWEKTARITKEAFQVKPFKKSS